MVLRLRPRSGGALLDAHFGSPYHNHSHSRAPVILIPIQRLMIGVLPLETGKNDVCLHATFLLFALSVDENTNPWLLVINASEMTCLPRLEEID